MLCPLESKINNNFIKLCTGWAKSRYTVIILYTVYLLLAHLVYLALLLITSLFTARNVKCRNNQLMTLIEYSSHLEANSFSAGQEIHGIFLNPKVYHRVHNNPLPARNLPQIWPLTAFVMFDWNHKPFVMFIEIRWKQELVRVKVAFVLVYVVRA